ncbi:MAG: NnrS family protein, partial [Halioglobus sp.]|nr:NnrS family protein [Halioglobus sp.]
RIVPAFTRNALRERGIVVNMRGNALLEKFTIGAMLAYAAANIASPYYPLTGAIAAVAALAQFARLFGWHGTRTASMPIVWVLHVAYLWLPTGLLLQALFVLGEFSFAAYWQHALGAGVAGTMILAVMTRASLGHTARPIVAHWSIALAYVLLVLSVVARVFGPTLLPFPYADTILIAGLLWSAAFAIFVLVYAPVLLMARLDGKPG